MKGIALSQGDLVFSGGDLMTLSGIDKVRQDLSMALREAYGSDPFHPLWGSVAGRFIGEPLTAGLRQQVETEVRRVIANYIAVQNDQIRADSALGTFSQLDTSDVIRSLESLSINSFSDRIEIAVTLLTMSGQSLTLRRTVS